MGRTSVVMRGRGRHMVCVVMHALQVDHTRQTRACVVRGACNACGGRVGWYTETHPRHKLRTAETQILRTVAIPTIARDERRESE